MFPAIELFKLIGSPGKIHGFIHRITINANQNFEINSVDIMNIFVCRIHIIKSGINTRLLKTAHGFLNKFVIQKNEAIHIPDNFNAIVGCVNGKI